MAMANKSDSAAKALQNAIQMEIDGKEYYLKISGKCRSEVGKKLLTALACEEDVHRQKFESIYKSIQDKEAWPPVKLPPGRGVRTMFKEAIAKAKPEAAGLTSELAAVDTALGMEIASYDYYMSQSKRAPRGAEKEFYEAVAAEEHSHHMTLLDYLEYLRDPAGWFVKTEHPSFD